MSLNSKSRLLIIDDNEAFLRSIKRALQSDYGISTAKSKTEALQNISPQPDALLLDMRLEEGDSTNFEGLDLLEKIKQEFPQLPVIMFTAYGDINTAVESMKLGASDFVSKKVKLDELRARINKAIEQSQVSQRAKTLEEQLDIYEPRKIVGSHPSIIQVKKMIKAVAEDGEVTVLIRGETGTGKELVARAIHATGSRRDHSFVPVMLGAIPKDLIESELFGAEPGAYTDAKSLKKGYVEKAHRGLLFLDEIGELKQDTQIKLLRFLEEREFQRLGGTESINVDEQVITATNADLERLVNQGEFREDVYHRLKVVEINLPPLRERRSDIPELVDHFLNLLKQRGKKVYQITDNALHKLSDYSFPGNVRELKHLIESASFQAELHGHTTIEPVDIPDLKGDNFKDSTTFSVPGEIDSRFNIEKELARFEMQCITQALEKTSGGKTEASELLGYNDRFALYRHVHKIFDDYPQLQNEFSKVAKLYKR